MKKPPPFKGAIPIYLYFKLAMRLFALAHQRNIYPSDLIETWIEEAEQAQQEGGK